jgi:hypothetical protein
MLSLWYFLVHVTGEDYGAPYGHWVWYNFYSGFGASYPYLLLSAGLLFYWHHTCQGKPACLRWAKYRAANGQFKVCYKHHPDFSGKRPNISTINRMHEESKCGVL